MFKSVYIAFILFSFLLLCGCEDPTTPPRIVSFTDLVTAIQTAEAGGGGTVLIAASTPISCNAQIKLSRENANVTIAASPGYSPVLDFSAMGNLTGDAGTGIYISGSYYTFNGLTITKAPTKGVVVKGKMGTTNTGSHNYFINCVFHNNGDSGLSINCGDSTGHTNDGTRSAYNIVINCDSYLNYDGAGSTGAGGNADGFSCKLDCGMGNEFHGCRAWRNSDDGFDFFNTYFPIIVDQCWTWHSADYADFGYDNSGSDWGGNGQGFKAGGNLGNGNHIYTRCVAFDIRYGKPGNHKGFDQNHNLGLVTMFNCIAYDNMDGFYFASVENPGLTPGNTLIRNCVAYKNTTDVVLSPTYSTHDHNTWDIPINMGDSDFKSLVESLALAPRQADGSLPDVDLFKLSDGSQLIDKGVDIGLPYNGVAPDLGPFEHP